MIRRVTDQARRLELEVPSVKYQPSEVKGDEVMKLTVQMELEGSYAGIRRFLYEVEGLQEPLSIEKVNLTSQTGQQQKTMDRIALRLQMAAFFRAEGGTVPSGQPEVKPRGKKEAHAG
jgi:Tfp pilus assembly protein PilO